MRRGSANASGFAGAVILQPPPHTCRDQQQKQNNTKALHVIYPTPDLVQLTIPDDYRGVTESSPCLTMRIQPAC
jgi:hypothetical protein